MVYIALFFSLGYPLVCDSQMKEAPASFPESDKEALQLEQDYVHRVYEEIARHFSSTRHTPWPHIVEFLKALPSGSLVADIGCGNGKYLGINKELYMASNYLFWLYFCFICKGYHHLPHDIMLCYLGIAKDL